MKTNEKTVVERGVEKENNLRESFVLWKNVSKNNVEYLKGHTGGESETCFFTSKIVAMATLLASGYILFRYTKIEE